ncbi:MAG: hypothetical protein QY326_03220 [Bdellovibrionota bacterium]|nr:MAG: hypothetical protein QY326_03220 [Bdellovibrionota bacterium]
MDAKELPAWARRPLIHRCVNGVERFTDWLFADIGGRPPYSRAGVDEAGTLVRSIDHTDGGTDTLDSRAGSLAPIADNTTGPCLSTEPRLVQAAN